MAFSVVLGLLLVGVAGPSLWAQETTTAPPKPGAAAADAADAGAAAVGGPELPVPTVEEPAPIEKLLNTLRSLRASIDTLEGELTKKREEAADETVAADRKETLIAEIADLNHQIDSLTKNFEELASGFELGSMLAENSMEVVDLGEDMREFLSPIISELKDLTSRPREIEALRREAIRLSVDQAKAVKAVENIERLLRSLKSDPTVEGGGKLAEKLATFQQSWQNRLDQIESNIEVNDLKLDELNENAKSVWGTVRGVMASFFRTRGQNLLFAVLAFAGVLFLFRLGHSVLVKWSPLRKLERRSFYVRLADVIYFAVAVSIAVFAALVVLYSAGDWVLLGLALLFLAGIAWTGKQTIPQTYEQVKLILNLGPVREDERVVYEGVPWKVGQIGMYTDLTNSSLEGGRIRLPIRTLTAMHSRPFGNKEPWFPSENGQWVLLGDGVFGRVVLQTPDWVEMVLLGGSRKMYSVLDFVALSPENLSRNFRIRSVFGIDYQHQAISTTEVPELLQKHVFLGIRKSSLIKDEDDLIHVAVEFSDAGASSLDYTVLADFRGSVAQNYQKFQRLIPKLCVDASNEHGWVIPFTQVTLHQAVVSKPSVIELTDSPT